MRELPDNYSAGGLPQNPPPGSQKIYRKLGLLNGSFIGLALALGLWGWEAIVLAKVPVPLQYPSLILAALVLIVLYGLTGWLTGHLEKTGVVLLIWLITAVLSSFIIAYQPTSGRTLTIWLADRRFWGLPVYPFTIDSLAAPVLAGFFLILVLVFLAVLQNYRLEAVSREVTDNGRLQFRAWLLLVLPLPILIGVGVITRDIVGDPSAQAVQLVHKAIQRGRTYEGDLFALGLREGLNYAAIQGVHQQMSAQYTLGIGGLDTAAATTYVSAHFDNGAWINCRIINEYLSYCYDAAPPYTVGLTSLITGEEPPESCLACLPRVSEKWRTWLAEKGGHFHDPPQIHRLAQWGGYVLMRAETADYALECWFSGISPVQLDRCEKGR